MGTSGAGLDVGTALLFGSIGKVAGPLFAGAGDDAFTLTRGWRDVPYLRLAGRHSTGGWDVPGTVIMLGSNAGFAGGQCLGRFSC